MGAISDHSSRAATVLQAGLDVPESLRGPLAFLCGELDAMALDTGSSFRRPVPYPGVSVRS